MPNAILSASMSSVRIPARQRSFLTENKNGKHSFQNMLMAALFTSPAGYLGYIFQIYVVNFASSELCDA